MQTRPPKADQDQCPLRARNTAIVAQAVAHIIANNRGAWHCLRTVARALGVSPECLRHAITTNGLARLRARIRPAQVCLHPDLGGPDASTHVEHGRITHAEERAMAARMAREFAHVR
jgi:AraC-like DNA-binding protein